MAGEELQENAYEMLVVRYGGVEQSLDELRELNVDKLLGKFKLHYRTNETYPINITVFSQAELRIASPEMVYCTVPKSSNIADAVATIYMSTLTRRL
jgi:hypothetical protein